MPILRVLVLLCGRGVMKYTMKYKVLGIMMLWGSVVSAAPVGQMVTVHKVSAEGIGEEIGKVWLKKGEKGGVEFKPELQGLTPGAHGFHIHENPSCESGTHDGKKVAALAAGGHYDPDKTGRHEGPEGQGHKGDLPRLMVNSKGEAMEAIVAPRLTLKELDGRSLMIHAGGDNYTDNPPMGGGGARIACGVIHLKKVARKVPW